MPSFLKASPWYGWPANLAAIALCAVILGHTAAGFFDQGPPVRMPARQPRRPPPAAATDVGGIVARNIFCSNCGGADPVPVGPGPTTLPLALVAVLYAPPPFDPRSSLALVRDTEAGGLAILGIGDQMRGATVADIAETRIDLSVRGGREHLDLLDPGSRPVASLAPLAPGPAAGIRKLEELSYEIERATLEALLADTAALMQAARIVPEVREGRSAGFRLYAVRPDGVFARIGLRTGDVIVAVNGLPISTPQNGLEAFTRLRSASHISLGLEREGRRIACEYRIR